VGLWVSIYNVAKGDVGVEKVKRRWRGKGEEMWVLKWNVSMRGGEGCADVGYDDRSGGFIGNG
jgi:hypothetical protein